MHISIYFYIYFNLVLPRPFVIKCFPFYQPLSPFRNKLVPALSSEQIKSDFFYGSKPVFKPTSRAKVTLLCYSPPGWPISAREKPYSLLWYIVLNEQYSLPTE